MSIHTWLEQAGLSKYADIFAENEIDEVDILSHLSEEELESLGLPIGARKKLIRALSAQSPPSTPLPSHPTPTPEAEDPHEPHAAPNTHEEPLSQSDQPPPMAAPVPLSGLPSPAAPPASPRVEAKGKNSSRATAILIAVGVHVALILIATTLTIFAASKDEPEIIASIAPPSTSPQQEMKKKTVQKQVKQNPSSASAAAAPMAQMMKANAEARFTTPDVTRASTGPLGVGEGDLGTGAFGAGDGLGDGAGSGGSFFGSTTKGKPAVIFDVSASMYNVVPAVVAEIKKSFKDAPVVAVLGCKISPSPRDDSHKLVPYEGNKEVLAWVLENSKLGKANRGKTRELMNKALFSLPNSLSLYEARKIPPLGPGLQNLGRAIELLLTQAPHERPSTIFVFADFNDAISATYSTKLKKLLDDTNTKLVLFQAMGTFKKRENKALVDRLIKGSDGELKMGLKK